MPFTLSKEKMEKWTGAYEFEDGAIRYITLSDNKLQRPKRRQYCF